MTEQNFAGILYMEAGKNEAPYKEFRILAIEKEMAHATEDQKEAFAWFQRQPFQDKETINKARILGLSPIDRLHPFNVTKPGKVRKVGANQERILNGVWANEGTPYNPPNKGGSVRRALNALEDRGLITCVQHTNGRDVSWVAGPDLRNWIDAGGFNS